MPGSVPKVAQCEDYDSDMSSVKPGTRKEARRRSTTTSSRPPKALDRYRSSHRDGASDSGYSSHTSATQVSNTSISAQAGAASMPPPPRPATTQQQANNRPVIHGSESQRSQQQVPSRSASNTRQSGHCGERDCTDPACLSTKYAERRYSASQYPAQYAVSYAASPKQYQQHAQPVQYQYAQVSQSPTTQTVPTLATPRPRTGSTSTQARPASIHGYSFPSSYDGTQQGPQPSSAAYSAWLLDNQRYQQQLNAYIQANGTMPPNYTAPVYTQPSPVQASPTATSSLQRAYSARLPNVSSSSHQQPSAQTQTGGPTRTYSARQPSARTRMPGSFPRDQGSSDSDSEIESSGSEYSEDGYEPYRRARARDSRLMSSSSSRRPSVSKKYATTSSIPTRSDRETLPRNPRSDTRLDYISSSDNMDSDRTARAVVDRRTSYTGSSKSSRRPSASTSASGATKATTMSSYSGSGRVFVEGKSGRPISYYSKERQSELRRAEEIARAREYARQQLEDQERRMDDIERYQEEVGGPRGPELTADYLRKQQYRRSGSHASHRSHKTSRSSSKVPNSSQGIQIGIGGTVLHVYGNDPIEIRPSETGGSASFVIGSASGKDRDSTYHSSSKSSSSRGRRSRFGSDVGGRRENPIREEEGYEQSTR